MPLYTATSIVLRRTSFAETDRIVTLYTREGGKIPCIAKGARKPISRLSGSTETLTYGRFQLAAGNSLSIITQVDVKRSFPKIHADLSKIAYASYMSELVDKLVEDHEPNAEIFDLFLSSLYLMERPNSPEKVMRMFELQFMKELGYEPSLDICIRCGTGIETGDQYFSPSMGGLICRDCRPIPEDAIRLSPDAIDTMKALLVIDARELEKIEIPAVVIDKIARAMRWYIRYRSDRELKSLEFIASLKASAKQ